VECETPGLENGSPLEPVQNQVPTPKETLSTLIENIDPAMQIVKCENKLPSGPPKGGTKNPFERLIAAVPSDNCTRFVIQD